MRSEIQLPDCDALRVIREQSEASGFKLYVNPSRRIIPPFLGDFRPDAIARSRNGGIIFIQVKSNGTSASDRQLAAIAKKVSSHRGWEFRAIYVNPSIDEIPPIAKPTVDQLRSVFEEVETLIKSGHAAAALVTAWAALEALARLANASQETRTTGGISPIQAVQTLAEEGYIKKEIADRLREMAKLRNAVIHGNLLAKVPVDKVENFLKQLRVIASNVVLVTSGERLLEAGP